MDDIDKKNLDGSWISGSELWNWKFIHGYSTMIFLGVLVSCFTVMYFWRRYKYSWEILQILMIITIPIAVFGAKFYTLLVDGGWDRWYQLSGLSIYGALIFSIPTGMIYMWTKRYVVDFRTAMSIVIPSILIGQTIGRWGNFFNHEVYGDIVSGHSLNWTTFIKQHMFIDGEYRAPIFLYEFIISFIGYILIVWVINRKSLLKPGTSSGLYMIWYGIERFILQLFRDPTQTSWLDQSKTIPLNLVVSILFIIIGIVLMIWFQFLTKPFVQQVNFKIGKFSKTLKLIQLPKNIQEKFKKEYEIIYPIKLRRKLFIGTKVTTKRKYFMFFGQEVSNKIKLYIPKENKKKWSKKEINKGKRN